MTELADNMDFAIDSIKEFLDSPGAGEKLQSLLGALGENRDDENEKDDGAKGAFGDIDVESIMKIASAYKSVSRQDDSRIKLLRAIKPYVRKSRSESVETAIKLLSLARLAPLLGELKEVL